MKGRSIEVNNEPLSQRPDRIVVDAYDGGTVRVNVAVIAKIEAMPRNSLNDRDIVLHSVRNRWPIQRHLERIMTQSAREVHAFRPAVALEFGNDGAVVA